MSTTLNTLSARPELVVDQRNRSSQDPQSNTIPGIPGPFGRQRLVSALPLHNGPQTIVKPVALSDQNGVMLADPNNVVLGTPGIKIDRLLSATKSRDTRRL